MKASRFNVIRKTPEITYAFNSFTGALAKVNDDFFYLLDRISAGKDAVNLPEKDAELLKNMEYAGFVVDDSLDEIGRLAEIQQKQRNSTESLGLTIAPTLECNFGCPYCFETARPGSMKEDVQCALLNFIESHIELMQPKNISVIWYGGEPLLAKETVITLSHKIAEISKIHSATSNFMIITNGYLIDEITADQLYDCGIRTAQITIDGCEEQHNRRRFLKAAPEKGTYDQILRGINFFSQRGIKVGIRMNVDKENMEDIGRFVRDMNGKVSDTKNVSINFGHVFDLNSNEMSYKNNCLSTERFAECKLAALELFKELGLSDSIKKVYPRLQINDCCATTINSFVIRPDGKIYRCWSDLSADSLSIGTVFESLDKNSERYKKWSECSSVVDNAKCAACEVLPVCMGGCPRERVYRGRDADCSDVKYNINQLIDFFAREKKLFEKEVNHGTHH